MQLEEAKEEQKRNKLTIFLAVSCYFLSVFVLVGFWGFVPKSPVGIISSNWISQAIVVVLCGYLLKESWGEFFKLRFNWKHIGLAVLFAFGIYVCQILVSAIISFFVEQNSSETIDLLTSGSSLETFISMVVFACILTPIVEEYIFRRIMYGFYPFASKLVSAAFSSAFFGFAHIQGFQLGDMLFVVFPMVLGFVSCYLYEKSSSMVPSIVLHMVFNSINVGLFYLVS